MELYDELSIVNCVAVLVDAKDALCHWCWQGGAQSAATSTKNHKGEQTVGLWLCFVIQLDCARNNHIHPSTYPVSPSYLSKLK